MSNQTTLFHFIQSHSRYVYVRSQQQHKTEPIALYIKEKFISSILSNCFECCLFIEIFIYDDGHAKKNRAQQKEKIDRKCIGNMKPKKHTKTNVFVYIHSLLYTQDTNHSFNRSYII